MQQAVVCFPVIGRPVIQVLLGFKKIGFGAGKFTGVGGKIEPGETAVSAAIRELAEETSLQTALADLQNRGEISFLFPHKPQWNLGVTLFLVRNWTGIARESREIKPNWFAVNEIPYETMWDDGRYWLPLVLKDKSIQAQFAFAADNETVKHHEIQVY